MPQRFAETERKYVAEAATSTANPDLAGLTAATRALPPLHLDALYFDTPALTLAAHHITLRRREGGPDEGWHLKLPASGPDGPTGPSAPSGPDGPGTPGTPDTRTEVRSPLTPDRTDPPAELRPDIAALVRARPLTPVVRLLTTRRRVLLLAADGHPLAEVAFDTVASQPLIAGPAPAAWTETEVELLDAGAGAALLDAVEVRLLAAGLRRSPAPSKLARALGDARPAPEPAAPATAPPHTAARTATAYLRDQLTAITGLDPAVRRAGDDAVHRMRVATRRARSALKSFGAVLDRTATDPLGAELKWLAAVLGAERDREVLAERLARRLADLDPALRTDALRSRLRDPHRAGPAAAADAHDTLLRALDGARYFALLDAFDALLAAPPYLPGAAAPAAEAAGAAVNRDHRRLRAAMAAALAEPPGADRDTALHDARKDAKRARYSSEAAEPVLGPPAAAHTARMKSVQQLLGEHQDSVMCRAALAALRDRAVAAGEDPAPYDAMARAEHRIADGVEARVPDAWRAADRGL